MAEQIRESNPECKIIYVTAHANDITIDKAGNTGHVGFMHKPLEPFQLKRALEEALGN